MKSSWLGGWGDGEELRGVGWVDGEVGGSGEELNDKPSSKYIV